MARDYDDIVGYLEGAPLTSGTPSACRSYDTKTSRKAVREVPAVPIGAATATPITAKTEAAEFACPCGSRTRLT
jgi:hypothetical protein